MIFGKEKSIILTYNVLLTIATNTYRPTRATYDWFEVEGHIL